jgi:hypothetical protein
MHPLDNQVWTALTTKQAHLAHSSALARRFPPEVTLLGALAANTAMAFDSLAQLIGREAVTLYFPVPPKLASGWEVLRSVDCTRWCRKRACHPYRAAQRANPDLRCWSLLRLTLPK